MTFRECYAEEIEAVCGVRNPAITRALATVPRERFLGPGPWTVRGEADGLMAGPRVTPDADPRRVYHNLAIAIDPARMLYNGAPTVLASWFDMLDLKPGARVLHIGCGTGYYSAILGEVVGPGGHVDAIEVDGDLAARAAAALADRPWVKVREGDGSHVSGPYDAVLVNAGATHPRPEWLDALSPGGSLLLPLTVAMPPGSPIGKGFVLKATREDAGYAARFVNMVAIFNAAGARDPQLEQRLGQAMRGGDFMMVRRLRRDAHDPSPACWLHADGWCLSKN